MTREARKPPSEHTLSKSDFKLARSCATKLFYRESRYPDTTRDDEYLQLLAEGGYMVEQLAKQLFPEGISLSYGDSTAPAAETVQRLTSERVTLFEATLRDGLRLARVDILRRRPEGFDLYEVKAKTIDTEDAEKRIEKTGSAFRSMRKPFDIAADWREYLEDVTYQTTILRDLFPGVPVRAHLILVDKRREALFDEMPSWFRIVRGDDGRLATAEFIGDPAKARESRLTISLDVTAEVDALEQGVRAASATFLSSLSPTLTKIQVPIGWHCRDCEFRVSNAEPRNGFRECWGAQADADPHVLGLFRGGDLVNEVLARGIFRVPEIPDDLVASRTGAYAERQRVQIAHSRSRTEFVDSALKHDVASARYPLHFIDFEAAGLAVPHHRGMRPYRRVAFQWSCHTQAAPDAPLTHKEYLNTDARWPNEQFAEALRGAIGDDGTVLVWSAFEKSILNEIADDLATLGTGNRDLETWLRQTALPLPTQGARQLDMLKLCRAKYLHPAMGGSNSIKAVLDALWKHVPEVREQHHELTGARGDPETGPYAALAPLEINGKAQAVAEGTGAINAYFAMVYGLERDDDEAKALWSQLLLEYCKLDSLAMVLIWEHWRRITGVAG